MTRFWQSVEKGARLNRAITVLGSREVRDARPEGCTKDECCQLLISNKVCGSLPLAKSYLKELTFSGRLQQVDGRYIVREPPRQGPESEEAAKKFVDSIANARPGTIDKFRLGRGNSPSSEVVVEKW